jgi:Cu-Zn family superoxide dismutase
MKVKTILQIVIGALLLFIIGYIAYVLMMGYDSMSEEAVAVFRQDNIYGDVVVSKYRDGVKVKATFTKLPPGQHGFHIHKAGDLRGEGCQGLCEHYDISRSMHGGPPEHGGQRHTGDLGNIELKNGRFYKEYYIKNISPRDLWGRSIIVHEDEDDLGEGQFEDSHITGHSGKRIGCAIFGRTSCPPKFDKTRRQRR